MMGKREEYREEFHESLDYLLSRNSSTTYRYVAAFLTEAGQLFFTKPANADPAAVHRWHRARRVPHSIELVFLVIMWARYARRLDNFLSEAHAALDAFKMKLPDVIAYLRRQGATYETLADFAAEESDVFGSRDCEARAVRRWEEGIEPKPVKELYGVPMKHSVPWVPAGITGRYAVDTGQRDAAYYALNMVCERYLDILVRDDNDREMWERSQAWCANYEKSLGDSPLGPDSEAQNC